MTRDEAIDKLVSMRHHCFVRGVIGDDGDFRCAFRDLNRLYVQLRSSRPMSAPAPLDVTRTCKFCEKELVGRRTDVEFCDDRCRKAYRRKPASGQLSLLAS